MREFVEELEVLLGDGVGTLLAESGAPSMEALLATVPPPVVAALPAVDRPLRALAASRDVAAAHQQLRVAVAVSRALVRARLDTLGPEHPSTLTEQAMLGAMALRAGRAEGGPILEAAWQRLRSVAGGRDPRVAVVAQNVAGYWVREGRLEDAEAALDTAWRIRKEHQPEGLGQLAAQLGEVRMQLGKVAEALPLLVDAHQDALRREGPDAPRTLSRAQLAGTACNVVERWSDAVAYLRPVHAALGPADDEERRATVAFELGLALDRSGVVEESRRRIDEALRLTRQMGARSGEPHPELNNRLRSMARIHLQRGRAGEAEGLLLEGLEAQRRLYGDASPEVAEQQAELGRFCLESGRDDEALGWLDAAGSLLASSLGVSHPQTLAVVEAEVELLRKKGEAALARRDRDLAAALLHRAFDLAGRSLGHVHARTRTVRDLLAKHRLQ